MYNFYYIVINSYIAIVNTEPSKYIDNPLFNTSTIHVGPNSLTKIARLILTSSIVNKSYKEDYLLLVLLVKRASCSYLIVALAYLTILE